ncbi:ribonuclease H-like domain-containing protein [Tanacetum coccineum]
MIDITKAPSREHIKVDLRDDAAEEVESLSTKFPIVDWKTCVLTENFMYYQIFRRDGSSKNYKILSEMLEDFDRQDVEELYRLVKEKYSASRLEGFDLMLWGDLYTLFESDEEDEIWKNQHEYNLISWRLCDFCGIHILLMENGLAIHMLTEKKYPLSQEMLSKMLSRKLEVDHESSQAFELLRTPTLSFMRPFVCPVTILNTIDHLGKFDSKAEEGFFVGYSLNSKAFRVFNSRTRIVEENLHIRYTVLMVLPGGLRDDKNDGAVADINNFGYKSKFSPIQLQEFIKCILFIMIGDFQSTSTNKKMIKNLGNMENPKGNSKYIEVTKLDKAMTEEHHNSSIRSLDIRGFTKWKKGLYALMVYVDDIIFGSTKKELCIAFEKLMHEKFQMSSMGELTFFLGLQVQQKKDGIFISQDKYVVEIFQKFRFTKVKTASTPWKQSVCACARYQVNLKVSHLYAVKRIFSARNNSVAIPQQKLKYVAAIQFVCGTNEVVHKELGDNLVMAATELLNTTSSLESICMDNWFDVYGINLDNEEKLVEDASKQGRIYAIDADEEITLVSVQNVDEEMLDVNVLDEVEVMSAAGNVVSTASVATTVSVATPTTDDDGDITFTQALIEMKSTKPK